MASELGQAFYTVYTSSKEIIKNPNQRHLFCNTLDLLTSTCKTTGLNCNLISNNDLVKFWLGDVLPLLFDEERAIQNSAVAALEQALIGLDVSDIHASCHWSELKNDIVSNYSSRINELRDAKNSNWHKIWCLLIRVLDKEILRGASVINSFLSIVELGFRNVDNTVRAEAFICWRLLIKIFSAYDELSSPKRLKLICIPLKSSQSKSAHAAAVKFRTWWFLITCMGENLAQNFSNIIEPFLLFTFGVGGRANTQGIAQQYRPAFLLALPSLVTLLSPMLNEPLQRIMRDHQLEPFTIRSPLMERDVFKQHWHLLLSAAIETIKLLNKHDTAGETTETEQQLQHMMLRTLTQTMINMQIAPFTVQLCAELEKLIVEQPRPVLTVFNTIATENLILQRDADDVEQYKSVLAAFMNLCIKAKSELPPSILQRGIINVYATDSLQVQTQTYFRQLKSFLELILHNNDEEDYDAFEVKLMIWRQLSQVIIEYLRTNTLEYRLKSNAQLIDRWILWPLQTCAGFAGRRSSSIFDSTFCELWRQLLNAGHNSLDRKHFLTEVKSALQELSKSRKEEANLGELFDAYVTMVLKLGVGKDSLLQSNVFDLLNEFLNNQMLPQKTIEGCLNTLRNAIIGMKNSELSLIFESLKPLLSSALELWKKQKYEGAFLDEWKRSIQDKFRLHTTKTYATQIKDLFKGNDVFVIIPTVWSLNPEKLTDRQKERFAEKADIPALYNDMSQSQDSSIKPWTPKKIVIAKNNQTEIAIENSEQTENVEIDETPENVVPVDTQMQEKKSELSDDGRRMPSLRKPLNKTPVKENESKVKPSTSAQSSEVTDSASTEKYNFRKTRSSNDEEVRKTITRKLSIDENLSLRLTRLRNAKKDVSEKVEMDKKSSPNIIKSATHTNPIKSQTKKCSGNDIFIEPEPPAKTVTSSAEVLTTCEQSPPLEFGVGDNVTSAQCAEPSTEITVAETPNLPIESVVETEQTPPTEAVLPQELSPKKPNTRFNGLFSPPDRKLTNNSTSPTLRPKPTSHLTGRGAQLINMIRNKKSDTQSPNTLPSSLSKAQVTPARFVERCETSTPTTELIDLTNAEQTSTPMQSKEFLTFTKRLPSPTASPSVSILKRKMRSDSIDESIDSPAFKRKRVSFHDPPVSVTKEYVRDADESKTKPKRCLLLDKITQSNTPENKQTFKRRSRIDSIMEIEKFGTDLTKTQTEMNTSANKTIECHNETLIDSDSICSLRWNDSRNNTPSTSIQIKSNNPSASLTTEKVSTANSMTSSTAADIDVEMALSIVAEKCTLETVLERYCSKQNSASLKNANTLAKYMSNQMTTNAKIKTNVLETLSENHSKDFLDHAVQENLSSVVCDRLNLNSVLEYICSKSKINTNCRNNLLAEVPGILQSSKVDAERLNFIENLLQKSNFSDDNILDIIAILMRIRERREFNIESVSESAVDSSSNL